MGYQPLTQRCPRVVAVPGSRGRGVPTLGAMSVQSAVIRHFGRLNCLGATSTWSVVNTDPVVVVSGRQAAAPPQIHKTRSELVRAGFRASG